MAASIEPPRAARRRALIGAGAALVFVVAVAAFAVALVGLPGHGWGGSGNGNAGKKRPLRTGPLPFSPNGIWNAPLGADAPLRADSDRLVAELRRQVVRDQQRRSGPWLNTTQYSTPVYTVGPAQRRVHVTLDADYPPLARDLAAVPIPSRTRPAAGGDGQLVVYQPSTDTMWELWIAQHRGDGWHARWGGRMTAVSRNPGVFKAPVGATGTGLPLLGGLIRLNDLRAGRIDHALAFAVPDTTKGVVVPPAQRTDGWLDGGGLPEGVRFRLDPNLDLARLNLPLFTRMVAAAVQRYGMILRDKSGVVTFYGEDPTPTRTGGAVYARTLGGSLPTDLLASFPWDRLQAVR